jgi:hypothetical protein
MSLGNPANVKIEPCKLVWGKQNSESLTAVADVAGSLNNKYFTLEVPEPDGLSTKPYYVWLNVNAAGVDPAVAGRTGVVVALATGATAAQVASGIAAALAALTTYFKSASAVGAVATWVAKNVGACTQAANGTASPAFTAYTVVVEGFGGDLGLIDGDISISHSEDKVDVTGQQTGTSKRDQIRTGKQVEISVTLKETSKAQLKLLYTKAGGGKFTPTAGTEVFGWGTSKDFQPVSSDSGKLVLHPIVLDDTDHSRDFASWIAYPNLDSLNLSGENLVMVPLTFTIFPDTSKKSQLAWFTYGDHTQDLSAAATGT